MKAQTVLITGSSSGIGREAAYRLAEEGARVILTYYKGKTRGESAERRCQRLGAAEALLLHLDVTDDESIAEAARKVKKSYGAIDFLINNAGTGHFVLFREQTVSDIERQIRTNLEGLIKMTRAFLPLVKKGRFQSPADSQTEGRPLPAGHCLQSPRLVAPGIHQFRPPQRVSCIYAGGDSARPSADCR